MRDSFAVYCEHVESRFRARWGKLQEIFSERAELFSFPGIHGGNGAAVRAPAARLDLDEHDGVAVACDRIDLAAPAADVAPHDPIA